MPHARRAERNEPCPHGTSRARRRGPRGVPLTANTAEAAYLGWRPCRFPTSFSAPPPFENPKPTPSCWRCRRSIATTPPRWRTGPACAKRSRRRASPAGVVVPARLRAREHAAAPRGRRHGCGSGCRSRAGCRRHRHPPAHRLLDRERRRGLRRSRPCGARPPRARPSAATASRGTRPKPPKPRASRVIVHGAAEPAPEELAAVVGRGGRGRARQGPGLDPGRVAGPGGLRRARRRVGRRPSRHGRGAGRVRAPGCRLRRHPRRRPGIRPATASGSSRLRARGRRAARRARRQGHHVRHGRPVAQAGRHRWSG